MQKNGLFLQTDSCNSSCFFLEQSIKSYGGASAHCQSLSEGKWSGRLAIMKTQAVYDAVNARFNFPTFDPNTLPWIGLDAKSSSTYARDHTIFPSTDWKWLDGTQLTLTYKPPSTVLQGSWTNGCAVVTRFGTYREMDCIGGYQPALCEFVLGE